MKLIQGELEIQVNTISNWPLIEDLFMKWGYDSADLDAAKSSEVKLQVSDINHISCELSAWGIPWKRTKWNY